VAGTSIPRVPILLGHRGASKHAPENTFQAFDLAVQHGCDGFEFDSRLTQDLRALVCHDPKHQGRLLAECSASSFRLPALDDVIARYSNSAFMNLELKVEGLHELVVAAYKAHAPRRFLVSSFLPGAIQQLHSLKPHFPLGLICKSQEQLAVWRDIPIEAVMAHGSLVDVELRSETARAGKQLFVWTVNRASEMLRFGEMCVDGIISDDTALLAKTFGRSPLSVASQT